MSPADYQKAGDLFEQIRQLSESEQAAVLDAACAGDSEVRLQVMRLLDADRAMAGGSFLENRAIEDAARFASQASKLPDPGTVIGNYRLHSSIGAGGMGVVYEARDLRLNRRVALKILPFPLGGEGTDLIHRFHREARAASLLNHPNIITIFDAGCDQGHYYIATEFVEGKTLRSLAAEGPLDAKLLIEVAIQICSALAAAHGAGIVHRDIKPENVMIRPDGIVKVLDFGLAKTEATPEIDVTLSRTGTIVGTASYMSPEQARGEELDGRTDLFSLGAVLYEMAAGRKAFSGNTAALIHDAILNLAPPPPSRFNSGLPPQMDEIILKCLEKDRELRCQSADELRADFKRLKRDTESGRSEAAASTVTPAFVPRPGVPRRWDRRWAGVALIPLAVAAAWFLLRPGARTAPITERQLTASLGSMVREAAISPDGTTLAYCDAGGLHAKIIDTGETHDLSSPPNASFYQIVWFPNSRDLLLSMWNSDVRTELWTVSLFGGTPRLLRDDVRDISISWDGSQIAFTPNVLDSVWIMHSDGENAQKLISAPATSTFNFPFWYPGDKTILYGSVVNERKVLKSFSLETGRPGPFNTSDNLGWEFFSIRSGRMLVFGGEPQVNGVYELKADLTNPRPVEQARLIRNWPELYIWRPTVSADGKRMTFLKRTSDQIAFVAEIKDGGKRLENIRPLVNTGKGNRVRGWTPDGSAVIVETNRSGAWEIFRQRLDSAKQEPLLTTQQPECCARLSPDGRWLFYLLRKRNDEAALMRMPVSGGIPQLVWSNPKLHNVYCTSPPANFCVAGLRDQDELVFYRFDPTWDPPPGGFRDTQLRVVGRTEYPSDGAPSGWALSPDGSNIATVNPEQKPGRIHVVSLAGKPDEHLPPPYDVVVKGWSGLVVVNWAHRGKGWYVSNEVPRKGIYFLYVDLAGNATVLNTPDTFVPNWGVASPDGRHLAFTCYPGIQNAWLLENF